MSPSPFVNIVASDLRAAETAVDQSIARAALVLSHLDGRASEGLTAAFGHTAVISLGEAIQSGIAMRTRLVQAHDRVTRDAVENGIALGGWTEDKPPMTAPKALAEVGRGTVLT